MHVCLTQFQELDWSGLSRFLAAQYLRSTWPVITNKFLSTKKGSLQVSLLHINHVRCSIRPRGGTFRPLPEFHEEQKKYDLTGVPGEAKEILVYTFITVEGEKGRFQRDYYVRDFYDWRSHTLQAIHECGNRETHSSCQFRESVAAHGRRKVDSEIDLSWMQKWPMGKEHQRYHV